VKKQVSFTVDTEGRNLGEMLGVSEKRVVEMEVDFKKSLEAALHNGCIDHLIMYQDIFTRYDGAELFLAMDMLNMTLFLLEKTDVIVKRGGQNGG
jgi:hypothetical protein